MDHRKRRFGGLSINRYLLGMNGLAEVIKQKTNNPGKMKTSIFIITAILLLMTFHGKVKSQAITAADITIDRNGILLKGKFFPANEPGISPTVILLHGFPGGESDVLGIGNKLARAGMNALTFNYCGTYKSGGENSWDNIQLDINAAFGFAHRPENIRQFKIDTTKLYLGGWCTGGGMALTYAACHPKVDVVFSIAGSDQTEFMKLYTGNPQIKKGMDAAFAEFTAPKGHVRFDPGATLQAIAEKGIDKIDTIYNLKKMAPLLAPKDILLVGGWDDAQTTMEAFILPLYRALQKENAKRVRMIAFQDDHYFGKSKTVLAETVIDWLKTAPERK